MFHKIIIFTFFIILSFGSFAAGENCGENEEYRISSACQPTCANRNPPRCTDRYGCYCRTNFIRNELNNKCVMERNCPYPQTNMVFNMGRQAGSVLGDMNAILVEMMTKGTYNGVEILSLIPRTIIESLTKSLGVFVEIVHNILSFIGLDVQFTVESIKSVFSAVLGFYRLLIVTSISISSGIMNAVLDLIKGYLHLLTLPLQIIKSLLITVMKILLVIPKQIFHEINDSAEIIANLLNNLFQWIGYDTRVTTDAVRNLLLSIVEVYWGIFQFIKGRVEYEVQQSISGVLCIGRTIGFIIEGLIPLPL